MRTRVPKFILQGDQRKAKKWIPWAMKALDRIKNLTVDGITNKVLRPVTGVAVHVRSVNDIDFIRIAVLQKVGCEVNFEFIPDELYPSFITFTGIMKDGVDEIFWDFGDGSYLHTKEEDGDTDPLHEYEFPGEYTVTATGIEFDETASLAQPDVPFSNVLREGTVDNPSVISHVDGYARFKAAGFISTPPTGGTGYQSFYEPLGLSWLTRASRKTTTIPFQDIEDYPSVVSGRSLIWLEGLRRTYFETIGISTPGTPVYEVLSGSDLVLPLRKSLGILPDTEITPIDTGIDMVETIVKIDDSDDYPILLDPSLLLPMPPGGREYTGWRTRADGNNLIKVRPYKCMSTKTKTITVT